MRTAPRPAEPGVIDVSRSWGEVIAFVLHSRSWRLAGLFGQASVVPPAGFYAEGGWLDVRLHASGGFGGEDDLASSFPRPSPRSARPRDFYSMQLFPIDNEGVADEVFADIANHDRGFARLVHAATGISTAMESGWMGRRGRRGGVCPAGRWHEDQPPDGDGGIPRRCPRQWRCRRCVAFTPRIASIGEMTLGPLAIGAYEGEPVVEVVPVQPSPARPGISGCHPISAPGEVVRSC